jgi:SAM-dependent methyltransferase
VTIVRQSVRRATVRLRAVVKRTGSGDPPTLALREHGPDAPTPRDGGGGGRARHDRKLANVLYHDWEAASYDDKWSISYDERCITYAADRFRHAVDDHGDDRWPYGRALELGCGTGFFLLNLMQAGLTARGSVTDLSPGMVAAALRNAENLGLDVDGRVADAEQIPYDDATFDVVVGHAVLHHIPTSTGPFREVLRVLKAGWPVRVRGRADAHRRPLRPPARRPHVEGHHGGHPAARAAGVAAAADRARRVVARGGAGGGRRRPHVRPRPSWRRSPAAPGRSTCASSPRSSAPRCSAGRCARSRPRCRPTSWASGWAMFAYRSWLRLSWLDEHVLARVVPRAWFYNALITGTRPA